MPRPTPEETEATRERQFNQLPLQARTDIAQARNVRSRMLAKREEWLKESELFKSLVRRLHHTHKLTPNKIALLLGLSRDRIVDIIEQRYGRGEARAARRDRRTS